MRKGVLDTTITEETVITIEATLILDGSGDVRIKHVCGDHNTGDEDIGIYGFPKYMTTKSASEVARGLSAWLVDRFERQYRAEAAKARKIIETSTHT